MRKLKLIASAMLLTLCLAGCGTAKDNTGNTAKDSGKPEKVVLGTQEIPNGETIAKAEKYYESEMGVDVEIKSFAAGRDVVSALASGDIDFGTAGSSPAILSVCQGADLELIWLHSLAGNSEGLAVKKEKQASKIEDLKGMKIATPFASPAHFALLFMLQQAGMNEKDVNLIDIQSTEINAAWESGQIDAAYIYDPIFSNLKDADILCTSEDAANAGFMSFDSELVRAEFAKKYPDIVTAYIKAVNKGTNMYLNDAEAAVDIVANYMNLEKEDAKHQMGAITWLSAEEQLSEKYFGDGTKTGGIEQSLYDTSVFMKEQGTIENVPDISVFEKVVNEKYIKSALE